MKVGDRIRNATLQDLFDAAEYSSYSTKDGIKQAKIGQLIFKQITDKTWECVSVSGINNLVLGGAVLDSNGSSRMKRR